MLAFIRTNPVIGQRFDPKEYLDVDNVQAEYIINHNMHVIKNFIHDASVNRSITFNVHVKFFLKDGNPFNTLLVGAWDSHKISHLNLIKWPNSLTNLSRKIKEGKKCIKNNQINQKFVLAVQKNLK